MSETLERSTGVNRAILEKALHNHDGHYWSLCKYIERELRKPKARRKWWSGPEAIAELLGEGHTAATVIWETHSGRGQIGI